MNILDNDINRINAEELLKKIKENKIIPFLGAGMSMPIFPSWSELVNEVIDKLKIDDTLKNDIKNEKTINNKIEKLGKIDSDRNGQVREVLINIISEKENKIKDNIITNTNSWLIPDIFPNSMVITTNYDTIIEKCYHIKGRDFSDRVSPTEERINQIDIKNGNNKHFLYKAHGHIIQNSADKKAIVFTKQDYDRVYKENNYLAGELENIFKNNSLLFIGCSLGEDEFMNILKNVHKDNRDLCAIHYCITSYDENDKDKIKRLKECNIKPIYFNKEENAGVQIREILKELIEEVNPPIIGENYLDYRSNSTRFCGREKEMGELYKFAREIGFKWWVISGPGGSGKSRLAHEFQEANDNNFKFYWVSNSSDIPNRDNLRNEREKPFFIIADYGNNYIKELGDLLNYVHNNKKDFPFNQSKLLIIARDGFNYNTCSWLKPLDRINQNIKDEFYNYNDNNSFLILSKINDIELKEIVESFYKRMRHDYNDTIIENILKLFSNVDEDQRILYLIACAKYHIEHPNYENITSTQILEYIIKDEIRKHINSIREIPDINKKLNTDYKEDDAETLIRKTLFLTTIFSQTKIKTDILKKDYIINKSTNFNCWNELKTFLEVDKDDRLVTSMLKKCFIINGEEGYCKPLKPDLLGEYLILNELISTDDDRREWAYAMLFHEGWRQDSSCLDNISRIIHDFPEEINEQFVTSILDRNSKCDNKLTEYYLFAQCISNLISLDSGTDKNIHNIKDKIKNKVKDKNDSNFNLAYSISCFNDAYRFIEKNKFENAIDLLDEAIEINPKYAIAYNNRGNVKSVLGNKEEAVLDYNEAIRINPNYAEAYYNRGITKYNLGNIDEAVLDYNEAIRINPTFTLAYVNRGIAKNNLGNRDEAILDYNEAIKINPNYAEAYNNRGNVKSVLGKIDEAIMDYNEAIRINPNYAEAYNNRGNVKSVLGKIDEAIMDYNEAIRINPNYADAYLYRGNAKAVLENYTEAIEDFNETIRINPNSAEAYANRGYAKSCLENYEEAIKDLDKAIKINQNYADAYFYRGNAKAVLENYTEAIEDFNETIRINPNSAEAYLCRGNAKALLENNTEAIKDYKEALRINPNSAEAYLYLGAVKSELGNKDEAILDYNEAIRINPNSAEAYLYRGNAKAVLENYTEAIEDFNETIRINPNSAEAYLCRGNAKAQLENNTEAIKDYNEVIRINPYYADAYNVKAYSLLKLKQYDDALNMANKSLKLKEDSNSYDTRGEIYININKYEKALLDLDKSISLDKSYPNPYKNRAILFRKMAELEQDTTKKKELRNRAIADEKKYDELKDRQ